MSAQRSEAGPLSATARDDVYAGGNPAARSDEALEQGKSPSHFSSMDWVILGVLLATAATVRVIYTLQSLDWPYFDQPVSDAFMYLSRAQGLLDGTWPLPRTAHSQGPLYPYLLAAVLKLTGGHRLMLVIQMVLGCVSVAMVYRITRCAAGSAASTVAAVLCFGYAPLLSTEGKLLTESISIFLLLLALDWQIRGCDRPSLWRGLASGLALGLASALRPTLLLAVPLIGAWLLWRHRRAGARGVVAAGLVCVGGGVAIAPFAWHNYRAERELIPITSAGGITFWLGNNPTAGGTLSYGGVITGGVATQHEEQLSAAERIAGRRLTSGQASQFWYKQGLAFIRKHPGRWAWIMWRKFRFYFSNEEVANVYAIEGERADISILRVLRVPFAVIAALGLVGAALSARRIEAQPILLLVGLGVISCMIFYTSSRLRLPNVPLLAILGAWGLDRAIGWYRTGHQKWALAAGLAATGLLGLISWPVGGPLSSPERFGRRTLASMLARNGQVERARAVLAPQLDPNVPADERAEAYMVLGRMELELRRYPQAIDALEQALRLDPSEHAAYRDLAVANYHSGRYSRAIENARAALKYNHRYVECRVLIGECHARQQQWAEAIEELQKARQLDPENAHAWYLLGQAYAGRHRYAEAAEAFRRAAQLRPDPPASVNLAFCLMRLNQTAEARDILKKVLTEHPDLPQAKALLREMNGALP